MTDLKPVVLLLLAALAAAARPPYSPRPPQAGLRQQGFLDQGVLVIARAGTEVGREEFALRPVAGSRGEGGVLAVATVHYRDRELRAALELSGDHSPASYQLDVTTAGRLSQRLTGQFGRGRFSVRLVNPSGEVAREFPVPHMSVVLDDDIFDQVYFLPRPDAAPVRISVVRPRQTTLVAAEVRNLGPDTVSVAGTGLPAQHYVVVLPGDDRREFWLSPAGNLLKVAVPGSGITATRLSPPGR